MDPSPLKVGGSLYHYPSWVTFAEDVEKIDWTNLSAEDKQEFFAWLDEFFARFLDGSSPPSTTPAVPIS